MRTTYKYLHEVEKETEYLEAYQIIRKYYTTRKRNVIEMEAICANCEEKECEYCQEDWYSVLKHSESEFYVNYGICKHNAENLVFPSYPTSSPIVVIKKYTRKDAESSFSRGKIVWDSDSLEFDTKIIRYDSEELHLRTKEYGYTFSRFMLWSYELKEDSTNISWKEISLEEANDWALRVEPKCNIKKHLSETKRKKQSAFEVFGHNFGSVFDEMNASLRWLLKHRDKPMIVHTFDENGNKYTEDV